MKQGKIVVTRGFDSRLLHQENSMDDLIDHGTYYEIKDYKPIVERDEFGRVVSMIYCPYIPKSFVDGADTAIDYE